MIRGSEETKYLSQNLQTPNGGSILGTFTNFTSGITSTGELYACIPQVYQGTGDYQRIGNQISPSSAYVDLTMDCGTADSLTNYDITVHVFVLNSVSVKSLANYTAMPIGELLNNGDGTNVGFDGTAIAEMLPVNTESFRVQQHKKVRLVKGFGYYQSSAGVTAGTFDGIISPSTHMRRMRLKVKLPKVLKYDNDSASYPTNAAPVLCIGFVDNRPRDAASLGGVSVIAKAHMRFKDA